MALIQTLLWAFVLTLLGAELSSAADAQTCVGSGDASLQTLRDRIGPDNDNVIVHLFEWSWKDVAKECKSLGEWGYWGVQVSPPQEDVVAAEWWSRYQPVSYKLTSRSGSEQEFIEMVKTCSQNGVNIIVDAVINHMANLKNTNGRAGTHISAKCDYEGGYTCNQFHHYDCFGGSCGQCGDCRNCGTTVCWGDKGTDPKHIYNCDLGGDLPDLDTANPAVQRTIAGYLSHLVDIGVAGIRIDAAKHIDPKDLTAILDRVKCPGLFVNQETILVDKTECSCVHRQDYYGNGKIWEFNTPLLFHDVFTNPNNMNKIKDMDSGNPGGWACGWAQSDHAHTFVVNHDRLLKQGDRPNTVTMFNEGIYSLALLTLLAHPYGQPNILSSFNFNYNLPDGIIKAPVEDASNPQSPLKSVFDDTKGGCGYWNVPGYPDKPQGLKPYLCEHRWPEVRNMVIWRKVAGLSKTILFEVYDSNVLVIVRGDEAFRALFAVNAGHNAFQHDFDRRDIRMPPGEYCNVAFTGKGYSDCYPCKSSCPSIVKVEANQPVRIQLGERQAIALHVKAVVNAPSLTTLE